MKSHSTISKIKQELISMFASLDAWFDRLLDEGTDPEQDTTMLEVVEHILSSNAHVLNVFPDQCDGVLDLMHRDFQPTSFDVLRYALRDQLYQALCLVDSLDESSFAGQLSHEKQMDLQEKLFTIAQHLRYHLELLDTPETVENEAAK